MAYEGLLRVGLLVEGPGVPAGKVVADPVSTLDLPATFCDYAGCSLPDGAHSRTLRPLIERDDASRDFAYSEWELRASRCGVDLALRTVRTRRHKLTLELNSGAGELYDLADDPQEMDNRFDDPALARVRRELSDMIASRPNDEIDAAAAGRHGMIGRRQLGASTLVAARRQDRRRWLRSPMRRSALSSALRRRHVRRYGAGRRRSPVDVAGSDGAGREPAGRAGRHRHRGGGARQGPTAPRC